MAFQIDEDSPVALALTPRPVINTDRLDAGYRHGWTQRDFAQHRVGASLHAEDAAGAVVPRRRKGPAFGTGIGGAARLAPSVM